MCVYGGFVRARVCVRACARDCLKRKCRGGGGEAGEKGTLSSMECNRVC